MKHFRLAAGSVRATIAALIMAIGLLSAPASANVVADQTIFVEEQAADTVLLPGLAREQPNTTFQLAFSDGNTGQIVRRLNQAEAECGQLPAEYRADCLQQGYSSAEAATRGHPDYTLAGTELGRVSRSISGLVSQNEDKSAKPLVSGGKRYRAVKKSAVRSVNSKAAAIIAEAETKLLRSAGSGHRKVHYQRIAQAVGSTKKILRS